jgi:hypothetical protein
MICKFVTKAHTRGNFMYQIGIFLYYLHLFSFLWFPWNQCLFKLIKEREKRLITEEKLHALDHQMVGRISIIFHLFFLMLVFFGSCWLDDLIQSTISVLTPQLVLLRTSIMLTKNFVAANGTGKFKVGLAGKRAKMVVSYTIDEQKRQIHPRQWDTHAL